jgi:hypothetical protein
MTNLRQYVYAKSVVKILTKCLKLNINLKNIRI